MSGGVGVWEPGPGVVEFGDGRRVRGNSVRRPRTGAEPAELTVFLLGREPSSPGRPYRWVRWPDFWVPLSTKDATSALTEAYQLAAEKRVEIACDGGVGRTGTALAFLATLDGSSAGDAVRWVRDRYHPRAVETPWQRWWLRRVAGRA